MTDPTPSYRHRPIEHEWDSFDNLVNAAKVEAKKAMQKFPQPNYVISKIAEEAGEVVKAAIHCAKGRETVENLRDEMKQLIAMLYRLWVEGDEVHGLQSVRRSASEVDPEITEQNVLWANNPLTHKLLEAYEFEKNRADALERWQAAAFIAHSNLNLDIETNPQALAVLSQQNDK